MTKAHYETNPYQIKKKKKTETDLYVSYTI